MAGIYVDNEKFYLVLCEYLDAVKKSKENGEPEPRIPDYIGECLLLIAEKLATRYNFSAYTFKDDMVGDALLNCLKYLKNFNPFYKKPFAYFTWIMWRAFLRRIYAEKKQSYIKHKTLINAYLNDTLVTKEEEKKFEIKLNYIDNPSVDALIEFFEKPTPSVKRDTKTVLDPEEK